VHPRSKATGEFFTFPYPIGVGDRKRIARKSSDIEVCSNFVNLGLVPYEYIFL